MSPNSVGVNIQRSGLVLFAVSLPISHVPAQIGIGLAVIGWLYEIIVNKKIAFVKHAFLGILLFYLLWNILSALLSPRPLHSLNAVGDNEWPFLIMVMMYWTIDDLKFLRLLLTLFLCTSGLAALYAIWQSFAGIELYRSMSLDRIGEYHRAVGFYSFYLTFAALVMTSFFLSATLFFGNAKSRLFNGLVAVASFFAIIGSFARSIWLALAVGIPLFGFIKNKRVGLIVTGTFALVVVLGTLLDESIRARALSIVDIEKNQVRIELWKTSLNIFQDYPVLGVGEDNWDHFFPLYKSDKFYDTSVHPHNDYLNVLVASGFPGLIAFVGMWVVALKVGFATWKKARDPELKAIALGATLSLLGFMVGCFFQNYYGSFINCLGWWFVIGLIFSTHKMANGAQITS